MSEEKLGKSVYLRLLETPSREPNTIQNSKQLDELVNFIFLRLTAIYDFRFSGKHKDNKTWNIARDEWGKRLYNFPTTIIGQVLDELDPIKNKEAPNVLEFVELCKIKMRVNEKKINDQVAVAEKEKIRKPLSLSTQKKIEDDIELLIKKQSPLAQSLIKILNTLKEVGV